MKIIVDAQGFAIKNKLKKQKQTHGKVDSRSLKPGCIK